MQSVFINRISLCFRSIPTKIICSVFLFFGFADALQAQHDVKDIAAWNNHTQEGPTYGSAVVSVEDGTALISCHKRMVPASMQKLIPAYFAFAQYGVDYTFDTKVFYRGSLQRDTLYGDILIEGSGDPGFCSNATQCKAFVDQVNVALKKRGIKYISGYLLIDASLFDRWPASRYWLYEDLGNYYGAGPFAAQYGNGQFEVTFATSAPGQKAKITSIEQGGQCIRIQNEVLSGPSGSGDEAYLFAQPFDTVFRAKGTLPPYRKAYTIRGALPEPPVWLADAVYKKLAVKPAKGKQVFYQQVEGDSRVLLSTWKGSSLAEIIKKVLHKSDNLYAEHLARLLVEESERPISNRDMQAYLSDKLISDGIRPSEFHIVDGNGLSPKNYISPSAMANFLAQHTDKDWVALLTEAGKEGTARSISFSGQGKTLYVKTGSMQHVRSLAGYVVENDKVSYTFALIANHVTEAEKKQWYAKRKAFLAMLSKL